MNPRLVSRAMIVGPLWRTANYPITRLSNYQIQLRQGEDEYVRCVGRRVLRRVPLVSLRAERRSSNNRDLLFAADRIRDRIAAGRGADDRLPQHLAGLVVVRLEPAV